VTAGRVNINHPALGPVQRILGDSVRLLRSHAARLYVNAASADVGQVANLPELRQVANLPELRQVGNLPHVLRFGFTQTPQFHILLPGILLRQRDTDG
jgi:hypothetical protein